MATPARVHKKRWRIVGGKDHGGIIVRGSADKSEDSKNLGRLAHGAVVEEIECTAGRLHYSKLSGRGPDSGWVSVFIRSGRCVLVEPIFDGESLQQRGAIIHTDSSCNMGSEVSEICTIATTCEPRADSCGLSGKAIMDLQPARESCYRITYDSFIDGQSGWVLDTCTLRRDDESTSVAVHKQQETFGDGQASWKLTPIPGYPDGFEHLYPSVIFSAPDISVEGAPVSREELRLFRETGFLVKRGLLDRASLSAALDEAWKQLADEAPRAAGSSAWAPSRSDESTWTTPRPDDNAEAAASDERQDITVRGQYVKMRGLGGDPCILNLFPNDQRVRDVVTALLGEPLRPTARTRGVYAVFPSCSPTGAVSHLRPHIDKGCQQLNACAYLDDVAPQNGGFTVYPGSHRMMFHAHQSEANYSPIQPAFSECMENVERNIRPHELVGEKGTVIFWHGRLVHSKGIHIGSKIRWAVFADFMHDCEVQSDDEHRRLGQHEWFKDTRLFKHDRRVGDDMWKNWRMRSEENR